MDAELRRTTILQRLRESSAPLSASSLAGELGVSRQVIVGDIALLRATGCEIVATARGYQMARPQVGGRYLGKIACQHTLADTEQELATIVALGGEVLDVMVEHYLYGEITGQLNIASRQDVAAFIEKVRKNEARLLSELTDGVHLHTVGCRDSTAFEAIRASLEAQGLLYTAAGSK